MKQPNTTTDLHRLVNGAHEVPPARRRHRESDGLPANGLPANGLRSRNETAEIPGGDLALQPIGDTRIPGRGAATLRIPDRHRRLRPEDARREPIANGPCRHAFRISDFDLHLLAEGRHWHAHHLLGARVQAADDGVTGVLFSVWAPNAACVSVVGDFNGWDGGCHPMRVHAAGIWELFIPGLAAGVAYKYEILGTDGNVSLKSDPYGRRFELRPDNASIVEPPDTFRWRDGRWLTDRARFDWQHQPMSIYEAHLGSWQRGPQGELLNYREIAPLLVAHAKGIGFTHIEVMPITEHPYDESWGYQTTGYFAPTSRFGSPDDFRWFVDHCHRNGLGVILDWVPAHFPKDAHGLARFDGTALYEHDDPALSENRDWGTLNFNFARNEVRSFLVSSALFWLEEFHVDGLRVDAVAAMLYQDCSYCDSAGAEGERNPGGHYGGRRNERENPEAIEFMRELNRATHRQVPGALVMAEDSTSWPQVTKPTDVGGLGFDLKWNMGWMNDTLRYVQKEPVQRRHHQREITFSMHYAYTENFLLPLSHDEVVHCKRSLFGKMPGEDWHRFAGLRLLYLYMFTHPGKKLLFMGGEFGQRKEWNAASALDWHLRDCPFHHGVERLVRDLNGLYRREPSLHGLDFDQRGFEWIDSRDAQNSILVYLRRMGEEFVVVALNFTPVPWMDYRIGVPSPGIYREIANSDARDYAGTGMGNWGGLAASEAIPWMDRPHSLAINLPPLAGIVLKPMPEPAWPSRVRTEATSIEVVADLSRAVQ